MYKPSGYSLALTNNKLIFKLSSGQKSQQQILEEREQRFGTKRTHSAAGDTSSKRIRIEEQIIEEEFRVYNPDDFVSDAHFYRNSSPPNLIQTSSKLWLGAVYSVKILFLKLHIKLTSHNALKIFSDFAIDSSRIADYSGMINKWKLAEDMHSYTYGDKFFTLTTFDANMQKILEFIQTFQEIDVMDVRRDLKKFLMNRMGFSFNRLNYYIDARIGGETYSYNIVCALLMASKEQLEKLTVAQICEKLKSRKLPASGPKSELVTRLFDSLMAEERLLEEGPGGESIDLSGVNMDEVLGLDDEKDTHSSTTANEDIEEGKEKQPARKVRRF
uniref:SAP domain-containing protein n=1 Tax=Meloidogyne enterolobii TaxID=390850 RepID=A0A6V7Y2C8_MELEN|nr:unnamed protein product [Meloidogyne enterolobii]